MSRLERAVSDSGSCAFAMKFCAGFPAEILSGCNPFSDGSSAVLGDIIHPDDYQPFCEVINEIINGKVDEIKVHARILSDGVYKWYYISGRAAKKDDGTLAELDGMMFDVTDYLECDGDDEVMRRFRKKMGAFFGAKEENVSLRDILGEDYLLRIQKPFAHISGLYSVITDSAGELSVSSDGEGRINVNKMNYQRKKAIVVRHKSLATWVIASDTQEAVDENAQLLGILAETVSGIANSYVVLNEEMENAQSANRMLGQNFEDTILINNIYSLVLESKTIKTAFSSIIPLISEYFGLCDIMYCSDTTRPIRIYGWDKSGMMLPVVSDITDNDRLYKQLDDMGLVCVHESELHDPRGADRSFALVRTYLNGKSNGVIVYISPKSDRSWSNRERKQLRNLTQILCMVISRAFTEEQLTASQERLEHLAYYDVTTNIPNRSMFERDFKSAVMGGESGSVIALELSNMKQLSEYFSLELAEEVLKSAAEYIAALPYSGQKSVYRFSHDMLFVALSGSSEEEAKQLAQAILTKFRSPWYQGSNELHLEVYAGITGFPRDAEDFGDFVKAATSTLRLAKERKLNDAACYSEGIEDKLEDSLRVKEIIKTAAENGFSGFYFLYSPIVSPKTGALRCCEANLFWGDDDISIPRDRFLPIIDRMGMSEQIYCFVVDKVCEFCAMVRENGIRHFRVSLAIPDNILESDICIDALRTSLLEYALPPEAISLSVSEKGYGGVVFKRLAKIGVNIIADDRHDGFFDASFLNNEDIRTVKIRGSRFLDNSVSSSFMRSVIMDAHDRNISVCVKDVDNAEVFEKICKFDVDLVEGLFNGRPLRSEEFIEKLLPKRAVRRR